MRLRKCYVGYEYTTRILYNTDDKSELEIIEMRFGIFYVMKNHQLSIYGFILGFFFTNRNESLNIMVSLVFS